MTLAQKSGLGIVIAAFIGLPFAPLPIFGLVAVGIAAAAVGGLLLLSARPSQRGISSNEAPAHPDLRTATGFPKTEAEDDDAN